MTTALNITQATTWAAAQRAGSAGSKSVLMFLSWALFDGRRPLTHAVIAEHAEVPVRSVAGHLETLESLGLIRQTRRPRQPTVIELLAQWGGALAPELPSAPVIGGEAGRLFAWMLEQDPTGVPFRDILARGPRPIRSTDAADEAVKELLRLGLAEETCQRPRRVRLTTTALVGRPILTSELTH